MLIRYDDTHLGWIALEIADSDHPTRANPITTIGENDVLSPTIIFFAIYGIN
jgi:hypothetical protein